MATKSEMQKRRMSLKQFVKDTLGRGELLPGQIMPPVRQLAEEHKLSLSVVNQVLQEFADEGMLYSVPRVGTFVGQRYRHSSEFYLLLVPDRPQDKERQFRLQLGFEERITQLGGASLVMFPEQAFDLRDRGELPPLTGIFNYAYHPEREINWHDDGSIPSVGFASWMEDSEHSDIVSFDDVDGGRQAAQCLIGMGHRQIAFLSINPASYQEGVYLWSVDREAGWRQALVDAGLRPEGLAFYLNYLLPFRCPNEEGVEAAQQASRTLARRRDITAVVAANDTMACGLFAALEEVGIPQENWPAIVSFDNFDIFPSASRYMLTSFSLPWDELGRTAADLLWQRKNGKLIGPPEHRRIPVRLIRRMTSQAGWSFTVPEVKVKKRAIARDDVSVVS